MHITWSGVDLVRPNSSLLNITFYDNAGSIVKVCGGKPQIQFRIPKSLKYALGTQVLTADDISVIFIKRKRMLETHPIDNTAVVQVELPNSDQSRKQTCSSCTVHIGRPLPHGSCPGLDMCIQCFTYAVDESQGIGSASMQSMLTCSPCLVEFEPSYAHEI